MRSTILFGSFLSKAPMSRERTLSKNLLPSSRNHARSYYLSKRARQSTNLLQSSSHYSQRVTSSSMVVTLTTPTRSAAPKNWKLRACSLSDLVFLVEKKVPGMARRSCLAAQRLPGPKSRRFSRRPQHKPMGSRAVTGLARPVRATTLKWFTMVSVVSSR